MRSTFARVSVALTIAALCSAAAPIVRAQSKPPAPDPAKIEDAKKHMKAGAAFYNDPAGHKCEEALREFGKAYDLSGSLNALKGMAICNLELERDGEAIEQYTAFLAGKGSAIDPADKAQAEADLNALKQAVARVKLDSDRPGTKITDTRTPSKGYPIINTYTLPPGGKAIGLHPGQHTFTASVEGKPDLVWKTEIANGGAYGHVFEFAKIKLATAPEAKPMRAIRPLTTPVYITGGLTAALLVPTVALMVRAKIKNNDFNAANGKESAALLTPLRDQVKSANLLADVFLGVTSASLITTGVFFFTRPTRMVPAKTGTTTWTLAPAVGASSGGAALEGTF